MRHLSRRGAAAVVIALLVPAADAAAQNTLDDTIAPGAPGAFRPLVERGGERYTVRAGGIGTPRSGREDRRRSIAFFGQLTDPQIADEMSPARVDFIDVVGGALSSAQRPQEALGTQTFDHVVRAMNDNRRSNVAGAGGRRAQLGFAITTGDLADNQQLNETRWFSTILSGGRVDPFSGKPVGPGNPCSGARDEDVARMNADVAARRYTGIQDYDDWTGRPADRYTAFWDPDVAPPGGAFAAFPRYPALLDRAQQAFTAEGLEVPWYISRGNHDGLIQGEAPASADLFQFIATSCVKVFPSEGFDAAQFRGREAEIYVQLRNPQFVQTLLGGAGQTPPDPDRRFVNKAEYKRIVGHGFSNVDRTQNSRSRGTASYYAFTRDGIRFISLDTVAEGGGSRGNLDDHQYRWLESELRRARARDQLVIPFAHHTIGTMDNATADETAGTCDRPDEPGCDADPRRSTPLHLGAKGKASVRDLFLRYPNVIAFVAGHTHDNRVRAFRRGGSGFWEINTASHADWPQQSRLIEVMDNDDGTLSLFGTILDSDAPAAAPAPGTPATAFTDRQLASVSRMLAANDPQAALSASGSRRDRNVELIVRDPRD